MIVVDDTQEMARLIMINNVAMADDIIKTLREAGFSTEHMSIYRDTLAQEVIDRSH